MTEVQGPSWKYTHRAARWFVSLAAVALLSGGCERWPWESKSEPVKNQAQPMPVKPISQLPPSPSADAVAASQDVVAKVNQGSVSTTDVELATVELRRYVQASGQEWKPLSAQEMPEALDLTDLVNNLVDSELKAQEAKARGLDLKPDFKRQLAYLQRNFYAQEWDRWQRGHALPSEEDIHQFYEQNKAGFQDPERLRVRMIVTLTLSEAEALRATAVQGEDFAQLAREHSVGPGKEQGGEAGWYVREVHRRLLVSIGQLKDEKTFFDQLEPVVFSMQEVGQVSMPVKGPDGRYYIVKLEERKPARQRTELEVHDAIQEGLMVQRIQKELDQLRANARIEQFPERLKDVSQ